MIYSVDTSSLVEAWNHQLPPDVFPAVWSHLSQLFSNCKAVISEEVKREIEKKDDDLKAWVKAHVDKKAIVGVAEVQAAMKLILGTDRGQKLVNDAPGRNTADPWVIAVAKTRNGAVVSEEKGAARRVRIPDVCAEHSIECIKVVGLLRATKFRAT